MLSEIVPKIPLDSNSTKFFKIEPEYKLNSLNIYFDWKEKFELDNIFLILKSYLLSKEILIRGIYITASNENYYKNNIKPNFFRNINIKKIEKISFLDFSLFYEEMFENDYQLYLNNYNFYGFTIIFMKESEIWNNKKFYPIYPWNENFKNSYIFKKNNINELKSLKKEIFKLKKILKKYSLYRYARRK